MVVSLTQRQADRSCSGTFGLPTRFARSRHGIDIAGRKEATMNGIIYLIGLIVVILAILSFFGLR